MADNRNLLFALGLGAGLLCGIFIGLALQNPLLGIPAGLLLGAAMGMALVTWAGPD